MRGERAKTLRSDILVVSHGQSEKSGSEARQSRSEEERETAEKGCETDRRKKSAPKKSAPKKSVSKKTGPKGTRPMRHFAFGTIEQVEHFSASPEVVYRALMDGKLHGAFTGAVAKIATKVGGTFSAWGGYIRGRVLELVPGEKIVQAWRTLDFPSGYPDSNLEIRLTPESGGTKLRLLQTKVPEQSVESYHSGWHSNYWQPLRAWLTTLPQQLELPARKNSKQKKKTKSPRK